MSRVFNWHSRSCLPADANCPSAAVSESMSSHNAFTTAGSSTARSTRSRFRLKVFRTSLRERKRSGRFNFNRSMVLPTRGQRERTGEFDQLLDIVHVRVQESTCGIVVVAFVRDGGAAAHADLHHGREEIVGFQGVVPVGDRAAGCMGSAMWPPSAVSITTAGWTVTPVPVLTWSKAAWQALAPGCRLPGWVAVQAAWTSSLWSQTERTRLSVGTARPGRELRGSATAPPSTESELPSPVPECTVEGTGPSLPIRAYYNAGQQPEAAGARPWPRRRSRNGNGSGPVP